MSTSDLDKSIQYIKGVGPKRAQSLGRLGIRTVKDILYYFPRTYQDRSRVEKISNLTDGATAMVKGIVINIKSFRTRGWKTVFEASIGDGTSLLQVKWFNRPYQSEIFQVDDYVLLYGKVTLYKQSLQMVNPEYEIASEDDRPAKSVGILPIYPLTEEMRQVSFRELVHTVVDGYYHKVEEIFTDDIITKHKFVPITFAIKNIHFPDSIDSLEESKRRLKYEEFFLFETAMALRKRGIKEVGGYRFRIGKNVENHIYKLFPFELTKSQKKVISEIHEDMCSERPMNRLLQGDVGSGKTAVAVYALLAAVANGFQTGFMAPTEILAEQHYRTLSVLLEEAKVKILLLTGGSKTKIKKENIERIKQGEIDLVIGTHALIDKSVEFKKLGLIVIDEQHKFGVMQRTRLRQKGRKHQPDVLVMTATPIPRSLSLTVFGDLDISTIDELPPGRTPVETYRVPAKKENDAYAFIRKEIEKGRQAFVVYPLVDESEKLELKSATVEAERLRDEVFAGLNVGLLHGQLKPELKELIMSDFVNHKYDILVSTIVIEVGIDVPNATVMAIEHAERFGLAQLHQLRGRIGRSSHQSYCLLFGIQKSAESRQRIRIMLETNDGFKIAEEDLKLRGPGEFFGTRQHGLPEFKIGDIINDYDIIKLARADAFELVKDGKKSKDSKKHVLLKRIMESFKDKLD
ncbi:MAG: ATP-dependent DNA helicase RecG, partial [Candidatus Scalindua sp.]|nr:ATP-dependent DNA helicase RecG [Candidatus Scalindua sp.]MCR4344715.1 ATP-dependent DNA helicase RecG [Candidatus Scalindua sp.]